MSKIKFKNEDKAKVLATLYNNSKPQGLGFMHFENKLMTEVEAKDLLKEQDYFDYLKGRVMKVDLSTNEFNPWLYDRDNGAGKAQRVLVENGIELL